MNTDTVRSLVLREAHRQGVDPWLALRVAQAESGFNQDARSPGAGAIGVMQLMPDTAKELGVDPYNLEDNIRGGVTYLKQMQAQFPGDRPRQLAGYNAGPGAVRKYGGVPPYKETQNYVQKIIGWLSPRSAQAAGPAPARQPTQGALPDHLYLDIVKHRQPVAPSTGASPVGDPLFDDIVKHRQGAPAVPTPVTVPPPAAPAEGSDPLFEDIVQHRKSGAAVLQGTTVTPIQLTEQARASGAAPDVIADAERLIAHEAGVRERGGYPGAQPTTAANNPEDPGRIATEIGRIGTATGISTAGSVGGALAGGLTSPVTGPVGPLAGEMAGSYGARRLNVALGLEDEGTAGDLLAAGGPLASRAVSLGSRVLRGKVPAAAQEILDLGAEHNIRTSVGDVTQQPLAKKAEVLLENVPLIGTGGFRAAQQGEVQTAAKATASGLQDVMRQTPYGNLGAAQRAAARGNKVAQHVLDDIQNAGDDWHRIIQASGNLKLFRARQMSEQLYDRVEALAGTTAQVPLTATTAQLQDAMAELGTSKLPDKPLESLLTTLYDAVRHRTRTVTSPLLDAAGKPFTHTVDLTNNTFTDLRQLRSDLGDMITDYYKGTNALVGAKGVHHLTQVRAAVEQDMERFVSSSANQPLRDAWKKADTFYRKQVVPYKDRALAKALSDTHPDEVYGKFIQAGHGDRAQQFYRALDEKGRSAVRYGMVAEALESATSDATGVVSPAKFAGSLERIKEAQGVFFRGKEQAELEGFKKLLRHVERAGQYAENPPTGNRLIPMLIGGAAVLDPTKTAVAGASSAALTWLLTSPRGRTLTLAAFDLTPNTPAMGRVVEAVSRELARVVASSPAIPDRPDAPPAASDPPGAAPTLARPAPGQS
jgi:hypothetical protein